MGWEADTFSLRPGPFFARAAISNVVGINDALLVLTAPHVTGLAIWNALAERLAILLVLVSTALTLVVVIDLAVVAFGCVALILLVRPFSFATAVDASAS